MLGRVRHIPGLAARVIGVSRRESGNSPSAHWTAPQLRGVCLGGFNVRWFYEDLCGGFWRWGARGAWGVGFSLTRGVRRYGVRVWRGRFGERGEGRRDVAVSLPLCWSLILGAKDTGDKRSGKRWMEGCASWRPFLCCGEPVPRGGKRRTIPVLPALKSSRVRKAFREQRGMGDWRFDHVA